MIKELTFFENEEELSKLTGLNHQQLWDEGFNLDDMDWGFVSDEKYVETIEDEGGEFVYNIEDNIKDNCPPYIYQILDWMDNYCVGFHYVEFKNKHYYTLHHA